MSRIGTQTQHDPLYFLHSQKILYSFGKEIQAIFAANNYEGNLKNTTVNDCLLKTYRVQTVRYIAKYFRLDIFLLVFAHKLRLTSRETTLHSSAVLHRSACWEPKQDIIYHRTNCWILLVHLYLPKWPPGPIWWSGLRSASFCQSLFRRMNFGKWTLQRVLTRIAVATSQCVTLILQEMKDSSESSHRSHYLISRGLVDKWSNQNAPMFSSSLPSAAWRYHTAENTSLYIGTRQPCRDIWKGYNSYCMLLANTANIATLSFRDIATITYWYIYVYI